LIVFRKGEKGLISGWDTAMRVGRRCVATTATSHSGQKKTHRASSLGSVRRHAIRRMSFEQPQ
jgi:hypothetical protein